ncbi:tripartite tricarboxylate transporter TctB family protein [Chelatococcus asaccharovorans]|uniref:tripartite tricarboxylate transporter TctB family protein n=1 Tax=Chelatococcus asaccharovorans TaxID=28210 RepID=UPI00224C79BD|nr:tripartite tricarboxylate transporter TctB family protein [Chelatococcus asaccharovorans]CAH1653552.1 putative tricarboxylic transport membrane protein [Chelatococcus asaccharovorans]CAH1686009.1 putative tricarboxylic transport membrane protein [Chelatococcus asaccharovorans]
MIKDQKSLGAGLMFMLMGGGLILYALLTLDSGTARKMGPGYFPVMIGSFLLVIGVLVTAQQSNVSRIAIRSWPWRQITLVTAAILIFAVGLERLGFLAATFAMAFVASLADERTEYPGAALIGAAITIFCTAVFYWGLGIPFKLY